jgi:hypothetical protein
MKHGYITTAFLVGTLLCSHLANAELIRVSDGTTVTDLSSETTTIWNIDNDKLLGAFNVAVDGTLWDVVFSEGSFSTVFPDSSMIIARTGMEARNFSAALLSD